MRLIRALPLASATLITRRHADPGGWLLNADTELVALFDHGLRMQVVEPGTCRVSNVVPLEL